MMARSEIRKHSTVVGNPETLNCGSFAGQSLHTPSQTCFTGGGTLAPCHVSRLILCSPYPLNPKPQAKPKPRIRNFSAHFVLAKLLNPLPAWQGVDFAYVLEVHESLADAESGTPAAERLFIKDATVAYVQGTGEFSGQLTGCKLGILQPWPSIHVQGGQSRIFSQSLRARARAAVQTIRLFLTCWSSGLGRCKLFVFF